MEILEKLVTNIELEHLIEWLTSDITHKVSQLNNKTKTVIKNCDIYYFFNKGLGRDCEK